MTTALVPVLTPTPERSLDEVRDQLTAKLGELRRRAAHTMDVLSPSTYWNNPWLRVGVAALLGALVAAHTRKDVP